MANLSELIHGRKPEVAPFIATDPLEELRKLLQGEIKAYPDISALGDLFQEDVFSKLSAAGLDLKSLIGLGGADAQKSLEQANTMLRGELPADVMQNAYRSSAFQNLGSGLLGSQAGAANQARQLGLTSLDVIRQGADLATSGGNAAQRWQQIAMGTVLPAASQLYTPDWFSTFMAQQRAAKQATLQFKYNTEAAPDPAWADRAKMVASLLGSFAGPGGSQMGQYASGSYGQNFGGSAPQNFGGGMNLPAGGNVGGTNIYSATTGGVNYGPTNFGGTNIPYVGGNVSTPSGAAYGTGTPGYGYGTPNYFNQIGG